jgi:ClpP class serine protease
MLKVDLRGLAEQYGVKFDSIATSELSGSFDPFYPINRRMKDNFSNFADRAYLHFKTLVGTGRDMDMYLVGSVVQG